MKKYIGVENIKEVVLFLRMEFQYIMQSICLSDHKEYSIGNKIPFLMNLPSPVGPRESGLGLSGKLTAVIKFFH